jgi:hypothetical protein
MICDGGELKEEEISPRALLPAACHRYRPPEEKKMDVAAMSLTLTPCPVSSEGALIFRCSAPFLLMVSMMHYVSTI